MHPTLEEAASAYAVLEDPQRRRIYLLVRCEHRALSRDEVAEEAGITRTLAAFHLEKLLDAGLLRAHYARPVGRGGPGAGRPAKRYEASDAEVRLLIPERHYELAGEILARAMEADGQRASVRRRALALAREEGRRLAEQLGPRMSTCRPALREAVDVTALLGYEPLVAGDSAVLANCPFYALVGVAPHVVCAMNQALLAGTLDGLGASGVDAVFDPGPDRCCVVLRERHLPAHSDQPAPSSVGGVLQSR